MVRAFGVALAIGSALSINADAPVPSPLAVAIGPTTRLLVLAPHPDDEALGAAGVIRRVIKAGGTVRVVMLTSGDAFAEGVETSDGIVSPTANDYRNYGTMREHESIAALTSLGVDRKLITFLGFPDDGLCLLASRYLSAKRRSFESPYTDRISPPLTEQVIRGVKYRGVDIRREIERIVRDFGPTILALPHPEDDHPDHCSTHVFGRDVMEALARQKQAPRARVLHYLVHFEQWPLSGDAGAGSALSPPADFPRGEGRWVTLALTPDEATAKKQALLAYPSQMLVIGRFMLAFGRDNELFVEGEPGKMPECWCNDGENVATEYPPRRRPRPPRRP
jgi:LmbE family N-acetylglucosaminyl deacetylase